MELLLTFHRVDSPRRELLWSAGLADGKHPYPLGSLASSAFLLLYGSLLRYAHILSLAHHFLLGYFRS